MVLVTAGIQNAFKTFGTVRIEWPGKDGRHPRCPPKGGISRRTRQWNPF